MGCRGETLGSLGWGLDDTLISPLMPSHPELGVVRSVLAILGLGGLGSTFTTVTTSIGELFPTVIR